MHEIFALTGLHLQDSDLVKLVEILSTDAQVRGHGRPGASWVCVVVLISAR